MTKIENAINEISNKLAEAERELNKWRIIYDERMRQKIALEIVKGDDK